MPVGDKAHSPAQSSAAAVCVPGAPRPQSSVHEHPGLLCKSNKSFKIGPTHPFPALITFISSVICPFPYICTQRSFLTFCFAVVSIDCAVTYALNIFAKTVVPDFSLTRRQTRYDGKRGYLVKAVVFWPKHIICETYHSFQNTKKQSAQPQVVFRWENILPNAHNNKKATEKQPSTKFHSEYHISICLLFKTFSYLFLKLEKHENL